MFDANSRYANQPLLYVVDAAGRPRAYVALRELPPVSVAGADDRIHIVADGERLDRITARYLGDPELFWRLCDTNCAMQPDELTALPGRRLLVRLDGGRAQR